MKVGFVADIHVGNFKSFGGEVKSGLNARCRAVVATLRKARDMAEDAGCDRLVILGDLFDTSDPTPQVVRAVQQALASGVIDVDVMVGNHDQVSTADGDHALGPLAEVENVHVIDKPASFRGLFYVPFQAGPAKLWLPELLEQHEASGDVLCLHLGIWDDKTPPFLVDSNDSISLKLLLELCREYKFEAAFAGNWHKARGWFDAAGGASVQVDQIGTLCPTGFGDDGVDGVGRLVIYDTKKRETESLIVPGPRFFKVKSEKDANRAMLTAPDPEQVYFKWAATPDSYEAARKTIDLMGVEGRVSFDVDDEGAEEAVRAAAGAARSKETLDEALAAYVGQLELEDALAKEVLERCRKYLGA